jgi:hypothetical protein
MEMGGQLHALTTLPHVNSPRYSLATKLSGPQSWSAGCGEEKNQLPLSGIEPWFLGHAACSSVAMLPELSQLELAI